MLGQDAHPRRVARTQVAQDGDAWHVSGGSRDVEIEVAGRLHDLVLPCVVDGRAVTVQAERRGPALRLGYAGAEIEALVLRPHAAALAVRMPVKEPPDLRSEEHTSELQSLMRISYAVFCLKKKTKTTITH